MLLTDGQRYVAFFDLLGFGSWVETAGSKEVFEYVRGFMDLMIRSSLPDSTVNPDMSVDVAETGIGYVGFSDSIVFYTRDDSYASLTTMLTVCGQFMNVVICGPSRMIRGAIALGEFYVDPQANAYVGKALIDAYRLEGDQDWLALGIHESVEAAPDFSRALEEYPGYVVRALVPLRHSIKRPFCINWGHTQFIHGSFNALKSLEDCYRRGANSLVGNKEELEKLDRRIRHTYQFLTHYNPEENAKEG